MLQDGSTTVGFANLLVQTFGWPCTRVDARAQPQVGRGRVLIGRASCAQSYGVDRRMPISDNDNRQIIVLEVVGETNF